MVTKLERPVHLEVQSRETKLRRRLLEGVTQQQFFSIIKSFIPETSPNELSDGSLTKKLHEVSMMLITQAVEAKIGKKNRESSNYSRRTTACNYLIHSLQSGEVNLLP